MPETGARLEFKEVSHTFDDQDAAHGVSEAVRKLSFQVGMGEVVCLLGASGCGKSTSLRIAAGVVRQTDGVVLIDGREVAGPNQFVPPEARSVGLMFQDYALFPHLTVSENVAFSLTKRSAEERKRRVDALLKQVHMEDLANVYPGSLSGGEQQRVALVRSLAPEPGVMLMDEPFSGLDVPKRDRIRDETWSLLKRTGTATLLVTHDPKEAMRMADRIILMRAGQIVQQGTPAEIYNDPEDAEVAAFFSDVNVFDVKVDAGVAAIPFGPVPVPGHRQGAAVQVMIRPHAIARTETGTGGAVRARVERSVLLGPESLIEAVLEPDGAQALQKVSVLVPGTVLPEPGHVIGLQADLDRCLVFPKPDIL